MDSMFPGGQLTEEQMAAFGIPQPKPQPEPAKEDKKKETPKSCPRCGWDKETVFSSDVTDDDKLQFVECLVTGDRFRKPYELFGGAVEITFRDLTEVENERLGAAARAEYFANADKLSDAEQVVALATLDDLQKRAADYRAAAAVERIAVRRKEVYAAPAELPPPDELFARTAVGPLVSHAGRTVARQAWFQFDELLRTLRVNAQNPNFWPASTPPG